MEELWQICELEDDSGSFSEFTVSAVPEIWIVTVNGTLRCFWPKKNARRKIKSRTPPSEGRDWTLYKCRLLMDEGKSVTLSFSK